MFIMEITQPLFQRDREHNVTSVEEHLALSLGGRREAITGAASGLGEVLTKRLANAGWSIAAIDSNPSVSRLGENIAGYAVDVRDLPAMEAALRDFIDRFDGLELMINNAGVAVGGEFLDIPNEDCNHALSINLMGAVNGIRAVLPLMQERGSGHIHTVASAAGFMSAPMMSAYNASKAAVVAMCETLRGELSNTGIGVTVSLPAFFKTSLLHALRAPAEERDTARLLTEYSGYIVDQAADDVLRGIARGGFYVFAPARLKTLWRWKRINPGHYLAKFPALRLKRIEKLRAEDRKAPRPNDTV
jgi:NAD(P)-dependent dehydrogenase (short-subunit alcohol dehydrogenase family)